MRRRRLIAFSDVWLRAWPRCREPVTFGGGSTIENGGFPDEASAVKYPAATQRSYIGASSAGGSQAPGRSVVCCGAFSVTMDKSTNPSRRVTQGEGTRDGTASAAAGSGRPAPGDAPGPDEPGLAEARPAGRLAGREEGPQAVPQAAETRRARTPAPLVDLRCLRGDPGRDHRRDRARRPAACPGRSAAEPDPGAAVRPRRPRAAVREHPRRHL